MSSKNSFVAFIDLLGFQTMVNYDASRPDHDSFYLEKLYEAHLRAKESLGKVENSTVTQFSDSIVLARPFNPSAFPDFLAQIAAYQKDLLLNGLLCRGGISFGRHFQREDFIFSKALVEAYLIESREAGNPRIVVAQDLVELLSDRVDFMGSLIRESDGYYFVNYLQYVDGDERMELGARIRGIIERSEGGSASIAAKLRWLERYSDYSLGRNDASPQFEVA